MIRNIFFINFCNIPDKNMISIVRKIGEIGLLCKGIPFTGKYTMSTLLFKTKPDTANASEQVNKGKGAMVGCLGADQWQYPLANGICQIRRWIVFPNFPTADGAHIYTYSSPI